MMFVTETKTFQIFDYADRDDRLRLMPNVVKFTTEASYNGHTYTVATIIDPFDFAGTDDGKFAVRPTI